MDRPDIPQERIGALGSPGDGPAPDGADSPGSAGPGLPTSDAAPPAEPSPGGRPAQPDDSAGGWVSTSPDLVADSVISRPLVERMARAGADDVIGVVVELESDHPGGVMGAADDVVAWLQESTPAPLVRRGDSRTSGYVAAGLTVEQLKQLVVRDRNEARTAAGAGPDAAAQPGAVPVAAPDAAPAREPTPGRSGTARRAPRWAIHRIWPNFEVRTLIHRTVVTTKCEAARRSFDATGSGIVWAVLDSGIDGDHPHFQRHRNLELTGGLEHRSFVGGSHDPLVDGAGHGTHVAGILAGELSVSDPGQSDRAGAAPIIAATWYQDQNDSRSGARLELDHVAGMAPQTTLMSCQVLRPDGSGDVAALLDALEYISDLNRGGRELNVHGVNLSVGYPFDPSWFGTGLTPVCREVDRLVRSGVLVVVAAGNSGYGYALDDASRQMRLGFAMTINDPGNAQRAVTVGSTSTRPHTTGVSYFSSKGPTGDGRLKPDIVAPGERVISAGAGALLAQARQREPAATYVEDSGTSMAAPHVSGVAAGFMSVHREYVGRPDELKRILMDTASDLGRDRTFQGMGLVDSMRAIQSV